MVKDNQEVLSCETSSVGIGLDLEFDRSLDALGRDRAVGWQLRLVVLTRVLDFNDRRQILFRVGIRNVELSARNGSSKDLDLNILPSGDVENLRRMSSGRRKQSELVWHCIR